MKHLPDDRDRARELESIVLRLSTEIGNSMHVATQSEAKWRSDLKKTACELRKLSLAVEAVSDWVLITDDKGTIEYANHAVELISGYCKEELIGQRPQIFKSGKHNSAFYQEMWQIIGSGNTFQAIMTNRRKNGDFFEVYHTITPIKDESGKISHLMAISKDLTQQRGFEERVNYLAHYDGLTGLPNRALLLDMIMKEVSRAAYQRRIVAVIVVEIDRLMSIRERMGAEVGDAILREVGQRLARAVREGDIVARIGRDKFGLMLVDVAQSSDIFYVMNKMLSVLKPSLDIGASVMTISVCIGAAAFPHDTQDAETLLKNAEIAMLRAREHGLNTCHFFTEDMHHKAAAIAHMLKSLSNALKNGEFTLHYQSYHDVVTQKMTGIESLIRWNSPEHGDIPPSIFIPLLEETRTILEVGRWIVQDVCRQIRAWQDKGYSMVPVTVNLSAVQFMQKDLCDFLETTVISSGIDPRFLAFELTESVLMQKPEEVRKLLSRLKALGISISIDDFGTGYSSLSYLKKLPADNLKIDISFIRDITNDTDDSAIVSSIVSMAHNLRLKTIAEGVETDDQIRLLQVLECDMVQGFYFGKPVAADIFEEMFARNQ